MDLGAPIDPHPAQPAVSQSTPAATPSTVPVPGTAILSAKAPENALPPIIPSTATPPPASSSHISRDTALTHTSSETSAGPPVGMPAAVPVHATQPIQPTATMDPDVPSSASAPTALPTNPSTHPGEQKQAIKDEHPNVIKREVEKTKAEERELKGEKPLGTVVSGLEDDRLWAMLRRFDTQITHVLHPATNVPATEPDLRPSTLPNLPSHSETLKSNLERLIAAIGPSSVRGAREAQRLMSWTPEERWRTGSYCAAYFICWAFGYTLMGVFSFFVVVACFPETRRWLFPPVAPPPFTPPSATDPTNQKGDESLLGVTDSNAAHRSKAEQAEEQAFEATSILKAYTTRLLFDGKKKGKNAGNSAVGEKQVESSSSSNDDSDGHVKQEFDPETGLVVDAKDKPQGLKSGDVVIGGETIKADEDLSDKQKKKLAQHEAKKKRDEMVAKMTKATEDGLGAFADLIERFTNALSPPAPYPDSHARFKMAGAFIVPPMLLLTFVPAWMFGRAATLFFGIGFWGQPLFKMAAKKFLELVPNWEDYLVLLDLRNSILSGVPTDAQLTLHLLRVGEALNVPLPRPPPPPLKGTPKEAIKDTTPATVTADDDAEIEEAEEEGAISATATKAKVKAKGHVMGAFKSLGKKMAGFHGDVSVDGAKKRIGTTVDKALFRGYTKDEGTINSYPAKLDSTSGHIIIDPRSDVLPVPQVSFVPLSGRHESFVWSVDDIVEIKKAHVSVGRIALGWASGADVEGLGLTLRFKDVTQQLGEAAGNPRDEGTTMHFTRVGRREQLFARLVSMGRQRWEVL